MRRRVLLCLTLVTMSACNSDKVAKPTASPTPPSNDISDAVHSGAGLASNPDFFFLPPMVKDPSGSPFWDAGAFNPNLHPTVEICASAATDTASVATAACTPQPSLDATVDAGAELYQVNWKVPTSSTIFYRITVKVGVTRLGYADVETGSNASQLKNVATNDFIPLVDGRTLPIKFRIERYALCSTPGTGPCTSATIDLTAGGTVQTVLSGDVQPSGISVPAGAGTSTTTITVESCLPFNPRVTDLPTFGNCVHVDANPAIAGFTIPAVVFNCNVSDVTIPSGPTGQVFSHQQADRITLHKLDYIDGQPVLTALGHAPACGATPPVGSIGAALNHLRQWQLKEAAREVAALLTPKPLYAARFIDLGGGGFAPDISDFQFALPAKMEIVSGDGQSGVPGAALPDQPTVRVTDLDGNPVMGARVTFGASDGGSVTATPGAAANACPLQSVCSVALSDAAGLAKTTWTLRSGIGANALRAIGRGIGGTDFSGPREGVDPFQPIQQLFVVSPATLPVTVLTGSVAFAATGLVTGFEATDAPWATSGFWHSSPVSVSNIAYPSLVTLGAGDGSAGALPGPFTGARALWFGEENTGNYAGPLANSLAGGTSTAPRVGAAVSPEFLLPNTADPIRLVFRSWFEIESVNPSTFDLMEVSVQEAGAPAPVLLTRLNPAADPGGSAMVPFTSGGFNTAPVWQQVSVDLSAYRGKRITLRFSFDTRDQLYNGFRGWIVDDVTLRSGPTSSFTLVPLRATNDVAPAPDAPARTWQP